MNIATFKLVIRGNLNFQKIEQLRKELLTQVLDIRALRDRMYAPGEYVFEGESNRSTTDLVGMIRRARFTQLRVDAQESGGSLTLNVSSM